ncbi:hypothetical protein [uncultured Cetobacterium sp.]|uniref:hypothetical protein n=1 Tax=uncultured Cetobacterium sp. TaxID=527638 RepID=UPI002624C87B|nr:hypothetical protein [uncultured Cetobacterium sp.]
MNLKIILKIRGSILFTTIFLFTLITWIISLIGIFYSGNISELRNRKINNDKNWEIKKYYIFGEQELKRGDTLINKGEYKDIIDYFEGVEKVWLKEGVYSKSNYTRKKVYQNNREVKGEIKLIKNRENKLEIFLIKENIIDSMKIEFLILLFYKYKINNLDIFKPDIRIIKSFNVENIDEKVEYNRERNNIRRK